MTRVLDVLLNLANFPRSVELTAIDGPGLDNTLTRVTLPDGQLALLREPHKYQPDPAPRWRFLRAAGVTRPHYYSSADGGASLVEWIDGQPLSTCLSRTSEQATLWEKVGAALHNIHRVRFPALLEGPVEAQTITLQTCSVADRYAEDLSGAEPWAVSELDRGQALIDRLRTQLPSMAEVLTRDGSRLVHGDLNLDNIIINTDHATVIDWDTPRVGNRIHEVTALEEHLFLATGREHLPRTFWRGYPDSVERPILDFVRTVGCLSWLASDDWQEWAQDTTLTTQQRERFAAWNRRLRSWLHTTADNLAGR